MCSFAVISAFGKGGGPGRREELFIYLFGITEMTDQFLVAGTWIRVAYDEPEGDALLAAVVRVDCLGGSRPAA